MRIAWGYSIAPAWLVCLSACTRTDMSKGRDAARDADAAGEAAAASDTLLTGIPSAADAHEDLVTTAADTAPDSLVSSGGASDGGVRDDGCMIAIRTDTCCADPFVAYRHEMDEDVCVQPYSAPTFLVECVARRPAHCATVDCALTLPATQVVGRGPSGGCQYLDECDTVADCIWARDLRECCGCPAYHPRALVEREPCLQDPAAPMRASSCDVSICAGVRCAQPVCLYLPATCATSDVSKGLRICR